MTQQLLKVAADFETSLRYAVTEGDITATLQSATDEDGVVLASGTYGLTIDNGNDSKEYIIATVTSTALTDIVSISRQGVVTTGFGLYHRPGATVEITDWASLYRITNVIGTANQFDAGTLVGYDAAPVGLSGNNFATVAYVLSVVNGGAVTFDRQIVSGTAGENLTSGNVVYLKASDQRWYKATAATLTTTDGVTLGIAQSTSTTGNSVTVLLSGIATNVSGLSAGTAYYVGTAGALAVTSASNQARVGIALSSTSIFFQNRYLDAEVGSDGSVGPSNKYLTQRAAPIEVDQSQTTQDTTTIFGSADSTGNSNKKAQSFIAGEVSIRGIELYKAADSGTFTGTTTFSIQADSAGSPSGSSLGSVTIANALWLLLSAGAFQVPLSPDIALTPGSLYWIVATASTASATNHPNIGANSAGGYANGTLKRFNTTDGWVLIATQDAYFKVLSGVTSKVVSMPSSGGVVPIAESNGGIIFISSTAVPTSTTVETTIISKVIPAGVFNLNTGIKIKGMLDAVRDSTSTGGFPVLRVKLNGTTILTLDTTAVDLSATMAGIWEAYIINNASLSSQQYGITFTATTNGAQSASTTFGNVASAGVNAAGTSAVDTSTVNLLVVTLQQSVGGTSTSKFVLVEKIS